MNQLSNYFSEHNFNVDELGRIVIEDPAILAQINGAQGVSDILGGNLLNGACSNGSCR